MKLRELPESAGYLLINLTSKSLFYIFWSLWLYTQFISSIPPPLLAVVEVVVLLTVIFLYEEAKEARRKFIEKFMGSGDIVTSLEEWREVLQRYGEGDSTLNKRDGSIEGYLESLLKKAVRELFKEFINGIKRSWRELLILLGFPLLVNILLMPLMISGIIVFSPSFLVLDTRTSSFLRSFTEGQMIWLMSGVGIGFQVLLAFSTLKDMLDVSSRTQGGDNVAGEKLGVVEQLLIASLAVGVRALIPINVPFKQRDKLKALAILSLSIICFTFPWDPQGLLTRKKDKDNEEKGGVTPFAIVFAPTSEDVKIKEVVNQLTQRKYLQKKSPVNPLVCSICENTLAELSQQKNSPCRECPHVCISKDEEKKTSVDCQNPFMLEEVYQDALNSALSLARSMLPGITTYVCSLDSLWRQIDESFQAAEEKLIKFFKEYGVVIEGSPLPDSLLLERMLKLFQHAGKLGDLGNIIKWFIYIQPLVIVETRVMNPKQVITHRNGNRLLIVRNEYCKVTVCVPILVAVGLTASKPRQTLIVQKICSGGAQSSSSSTSKNLPNGLEKQTIIPNDKGAK
jgi:hypothetical protein